MNLNKLILISTISLAVAILLPMPYAYYQLLRWFICGLSLYLIHTLYNGEATKEIIALAVLGIIYNPIAPIHLASEIWIAINIITIMVHGYIWKTQKITN